MPTVPPQMLQNRSWPCPPPLERHLSWIWRLSGELLEGSRLPLLPDTAAAHVVVALGAPAYLQMPEGLRPLPSRVVFGAFEEARVLETGGRVDHVGLYLPTGCACLLGVSPASVKARVVALEEVAPALDRALAAWADGAAREADGLEALLAIVQAHVRPGCDPLVHEAARALAEGRSVAEVADEVGLSRRQLTRRFEARASMAPRDFIRKVRFARAWQAAAREPGATWAWVAAEAGYADQPHLDRDFRSVAGAPPSRVFPQGSPVEGREARSLALDVSPPFKAGPSSET